MAIGMVIGVSYALWRVTATQESINRITSSCLKIELIEKTSAIQLEKSYPIRDEEAKELIPYEFTIKNTCDNVIGYDVNLEILEVENSLSSDYVSYSMDGGVKKKLSNQESIVPTYKDDTYTASEARKLLSGRVLEGKSEQTYALRLWMDEDTPTLAETMNKEFLAKISIEASITEEKATMIGPVINDSNTSGAFWDYKENITKIVLENELIPKENASYTFDVSEKQDGSVMSYLVMLSEEEKNTLFEEKLQKETGMSLEEFREEMINNQGMTEEEFNTMIEEIKLSLFPSNAYTLYIQGKGGIEAPKNSSRLFYEFQVLEEIDNLDYLDTRNVTDMSYMFDSCPNLTTLDVSGFDTRNVIDMDSMFKYCSGLTLLDVSGFDTRNVTNMHSMFDSCEKLTSLDVSGFDTRNVTNMGAMFYGCRNLTTLDVSGFDTRNVTDMSYMFDSCPNLTTLDVSGFDTRNVTDMSSMFMYCSGLILLDVSGFDTRNVTTMPNMFNGCSSLTTLDVSGFDTRNVRSVDSMFYKCSSLAHITYGEQFIYVNARTYGMYKGCPANKPPHESWNKVKDW